MKKALLSFIVTAAFVFVSVSVSAQATGVKKQTPSNPAKTVPVKQEPLGNKENVARPDEKLIIKAPNGDELMLLTPPAETNSQANAVKTEEKKVSGEKKNDQPK